jgi:hypothetical protein
MGRTTQPTIQYGFGVFDEIYERMNEVRRKLDIKQQREMRSRPAKPVDWIQELKEAIDRSWLKLDKYYVKVYGDLGSIYALSAILDPSRKLDAFDPSIFWQGDHFQLEYEEQFITAFEQGYSQRASQENELHQLHHVNRDPLAMLFSRHNVLEGTGEGYQQSRVRPSELELYLNLGRRPHSINPRINHIY